METEYLKWPLWAGKVISMEAQLSKQPRECKTITVTVVKCVDHFNI
jgi:hypothetical protein